MTISYATARSAPLLEWEDERLLIQDWQTRKCSDALERLLMSHARLVYHWARRMSSDKFEQEELVAEGFLGLIKAADMFDLTRDVRYSTYARWWVKNAVLTALDRMQTVVETPGNGRDAKAQTSSRSLEEEDTIGRLVSDEPTPEEHAIALSSRRMMQQRISDALTDLDEIDREVVRCRTLKQPPDTIPALAERFGMNAAKLRQLERRAMMRLRHRLVERGVVTSRVM